MLDKNKIPELSKFIAEDYLFLLNRLPFDNGVLLSCFTIADILNTNRVLIEIREDDFVPPTIMPITFGNSGTGKDKNRKDMAKTIPFLYEFKQDMEDKFRKNKKHELEKEAEEEGLKNTKLKAYVKDNMPRSLYSDITSTSTPEGLASVHEALNDAGFGSITWYDSEISDTMARYKSGTPLDDLITMIKESADVGEFRSKVIKGNKVLKACGKVPVNAWIHGAIDEDRGKDLFKNFLQLGFARRSIINFIGRGQVDNRTIEEMEEHEEQALKNKKFIVSSFKELHERVKVDPFVKYGGSKVIKLNADTRRLYLEYKQVCYNKRIEAPGYTNKILKDDLANRFFKAIKLAAIFAVQNHDELVIRKKDLEDAIYVIEYFGKYLEDFLGMRMDSDLTIAEHMIISLNNRGEMKRTDFYKESYFPKSMGKQKIIFEQAINIAEEMLEEEGKMIVEEKGTKNSYLYKIIEEPKHNKEDVTVRNIKMSVGKSNEITETIFEPKTLDFNNLHILTSSEFAYAPGVFNESKIGKDNWTGRNDLMILDIDNDKDKDDTMSIETAQAKFSAFAHLIVTTKSHQKEKKGIIADRYRIIFPITNTELNYGQYQKIVEQIVNQYGIQKYCDLPASRDVARKFMPNPDQEYHYNKGWTLNPLAFLYESKNSSLKRQFHESQTLEVKGRAMGLNELIMEAKGKGGGTTPCKAFCHDDKNASAFFAINQHGNFQYTCTACGLSYFYKLK